MTTTWSLVRAFGAVLLFTIVLSGCYTQMETTRNRPYYDEKYTEESDVTAADSLTDETVIDNYDDDYGYGGYAGSRFGFSYYYPLWQYSSWYWPSYYNPLYHHYWSYPFYGYYSGYYYNPHFYDYGYGYGYSGTGSLARRSARDFGSTRGTSDRNTINRTASDYAASSRVGLFGSNKEKSLRKKSSSMVTRAQGVNQRGNRAARSRRTSAPNSKVSRIKPDAPQRNIGNRVQRSDGSSRSGGRSFAPSSRPSRPGISQPRSGGGFRGGSVGGSRSSGGSRGGGSRGGRR